MRLVDAHHRKFPSWKPPEASDNGEDLWQTVPPTPPSLKCIALAYLTSAVPRMHLVQPRVTTTTDY